MSKKFEVFISYRRKGGYDTAKLIYDRLRLDGYYVSFDIDTLEKGNFDEELEKRVSRCKDFILVLNPGAFDRFSNPDYDPKDDWMRRELSAALATGKNIVPLVLDGFGFPRSLPPDIEGIAKKNAIDLNPKHFEAVYAGMKRKFLVSKPRFTIKHKNKILLSLLVALLATAGHLFFTISKEMEAIAQQKDLELRLARERADSIARELDSLRRIDTAKPTGSKPSKQQTEDKPSTKNSDKPILYWNGTNDAIDNMIFRKIIPAGVKKAKCYGNGLKIGVNKPTCETNEEDKFSCTYSPKLTITDCRGSLDSFLETSEVFETKFFNNEAEAKEELVKHLRLTNFDAWVSELENR